MLIRHKPSLGSVQLQALQSEVGSVLTQRWDSEGLGISLTAWSPGNSGSGHQAENHMRCLINTETPCSYQTERVRVFGGRTQEAVS